MLSALYGSNGYISWIEILWLALGVIGFCVNVASVADCVHDLQALGFAGRNGVMKRVVEGGIRRESVRALINGIVIAVGVISFDQRPSPTPRTDLGWIITAALIALPVLNIVNAYSDMSDRYHLREMSNAERSKNV